MDTRDKIIETAFIGFLEKGFDNISLNEIVKRTGLTKGAFYYYFTNKEQLFKETITKYIYTYIENYGRSVLTTEHSAIDTLLSIANVMANMFDVVSDQVGIIIEPRTFYSLFMSALSTNEDVNHSNSELNKNLKENLEKVLNHGIENGEFRENILVEEAAFMTAAMLHGILFDWVNDKNIVLQQSLTFGIQSVINVLKR